ncbi:mitotic checkpoint protein-domain-containing protein [Kockovaella imperatae]|uniref:Spindle assembly checkpoint component MAD1 n=1 Tax=Kockovaella imperatae TaxID=4999 RepID=A0A1Y1U7M3_9TREE|nr:mitotic checkpoint protein-domain-containing protein [Kockovaella imperatae]ORX34031.1 mitotic checkpoint protein-domain-containing protein [Kockovaella imperatae]
MHSRRISGTSVFSPSPSISTPLASSALGKRPASEAGVTDTAGPSRRPGPRLSTSVTSLQRSLLEARTKIIEYEQQMEEQRIENERLKSERMILLDGETNERETGEQREKEWGEERSRLGVQIKDLRLQNLKLSDSLEKLQSEHSKLNVKFSSLSLSSESRIGLLESHLQEAEEEKERLKTFQRRAQGLSIQLEEEKRRAAAGRGQLEEVRENEQDKELREALRKQGQTLSSLRKENDSFKAEVQEARQRRKELDATERAHKDTEMALKEEIHSLRDQLGKAHRDMDSLTINFTSASASPSADATTLQQRLQALTTLHKEASASLAEKDAEIRSLHNRLGSLSGSSQAALAELTKRNSELEREYRWAKEGRVVAERNEALAKKEVEALRLAEDGPVMPGGVSSSGDQSQKIRQLEELLKTYKTELDGMSRDSRDVEARLTQGAGLVKQTDLEESQARAERLEDELSSLQTVIAELTSANTTLDAEVNDLMRRVASGEYNPDSERCLELRNNPAAKIHAIRKAQLDALTRENEALLERLSSSSSSSNGETTVPQESYERLKREKEELEQSHAKRLLRLKEIFGNKSKEFLEAVYSLLGWRIKFDESGADIRLTSMYAPKGKMGLTLKFASQEGHFGTMQMTGAMAKGLEDTRHFWIVERQSVPGFLAQITTEMFEKTTIGRAAGYVGLE